MVQDRQSAKGEGRFGVGLNEWLHKLNVKKQGGTAHYAVRRSNPGPTLAYIVPGCHSIRLNMTPGAFF